MAHTIKHPDGKADVSTTITGTEDRFASGPPSRGAAFHRGIYIRQTAGASGTWRWLYDEPTPGVASPSSYTFLSSPS